MDRESLEIATWQFTEKTKSPCLGLISSPPSRPCERCTVPNQHRRPPPRKMDKPDGRKTEKLDSSWKCESGFLGLRSKAGSHYLLRNVHLKLHWWHRRRHSVERSSSKMKKMETKTDMCTMISSRWKSGETNLVRVMTRKNSMAFSEQGLCLLSKMAPLGATKSEKVND